MCFPKYTAAAGTAHLKFHTLTITWQQPLQIVFSQAPWAAPRDEIP